MAKAITVLVSTLLFSSYALLIGYLSVQAELESQASGNRLSPNVLMICYGLAPLIGALFGFTVSVFVLRMFAYSPPRDKD